MAARAGQHGSEGLADRLLGCADAAGRARVAWLYAARSWWRITTDTRGTISLGAAETADLALWTGRLAYADLCWTPALGPSRRTRTPEALAPEPDDLPIIVATVHHASETMTRIPAADQSQICAAAAAGRLLVPTRSLPDRFGIPHPFAPAPRDRVNALLDAYHNAGAASAQSTAAVATVATDVGAPSHIPTLARTAIRGDSESSANGERELPDSESHHAEGFPGPCRAHPARPRGHQPPHAGARLA